MAKGKKRPAELPEYGTVMMKGVQYYRTRITDADGKRVAIYGLTREELYDRVEDAQKKIAEVVFHRENPTVEEYCEKWLLMRSGTVRTNTLEGYARMVNRYIVGPIGQMYMDEVTTDDLRLLMVPLSKGSSGMYGQLNMLIKNIFNSAEESKVIKENPSKTICARGGKPAKRREALTDEQTAILLDSIRELPPYVFVMIGLYAGLRREEILGLKWDCNITLNGTFILLIPTALMLFSAASGQADRQKLFLDFLFYSLFTPVCTTMMNRIMFASEQLMAAKSAVSRIEAILQEKPLKESNTQKQPKDASVVFGDVSFTYPGAKKKALYHVSFEVPDGKKIALVGASGSGKSTAASLIPRFYDVQEGNVLVGGVDVREIAKNDLMEQIAFVFQNTRLFNDTLLENIRASRPDATREEVMRAAEAAQCQDIIERLPNGLDTIVGSGGTYLSGGENQRIALARAILKDAPIIILDEATAFADAENEHQIQLAFEGLTSGKTVLMIAHRLSTIQDADMILVFGDGKIIERGNHDELLKQNGVYASMWKEYQTQIIWKVGTTVRKEENHD